MTRFISRRLLAMVPVLFGLIVLMFLLSRLMPGDAIRLSLGPDATAQQIRDLEEKMGLTKPLVLQFTDYMTGLLQGDMGVSLRTGRNVLLDIRETLPATLELALFSMALSVLIGVSLGVAAAVRNNKWSDHLIRLVSLSGTALPRFWLAILLQLVFAYWLNLLPVISRGAVEVERITGLRLLDSLMTFNGAGFLDSLKHLILPSLALAISTSAQIMRMTRANMLDQIHKDYVIAARAYGLPPSLVNRYMLKNAFISVLTTIGMQLGSLLGNAFLVESVFGWPGLAQYAIQGLMFKDYNAIIGVTLVIGIFFALINVVIDLLYGWLDPRIKVGR
ncbi:ABC transporter permease [Cohnella hongkongensis]|uniref:ABC transporter permease n=1 Tax=Cohnella hongkongensis TaxID=178337 RepID=A0ABV9F7R4_9BACL